MTINQIFLIYLFQDDTRICRFYKPSLKGCFKGANCRKEHSLPQPEGWTKDVLPITSIIDNRLSSVRYAKNTELNVTPTYVVNLEVFYAQINGKNLTPFVYNDEDIPEWNRLREHPLVFSIVLARYEDDLWYRAKVVESDLHSKMIKIFYVDYGNHHIVHLSDLARCEDSLASQPFCAILMRMAGIKDACTNKDQRQEGIHFLYDKLLNKTFNIRVVSHQDDLLISFVDPIMHQLPNTLIKKGYMKPYNTIVV